MFNFITNLFVNTTPEGDNVLTLLGYFSLILIILLIMVGISLNNKKVTKIKTNQLVFAAASIALASVLSFIKPIELPYGGSMTLFSMFFITFIGSLYGTKIGIMTGISYGILQFLFGPSIYHPMQILLDYPIAFGCLGLSGLFHKKDLHSGLSKSKFKTSLIIGYIVGVFGRYIFHVISGYIFFKQYAPVGKNAFIYTLSYNATYIVPELILTLIILLLPPISHVLFELKKLSVEV
jgi:thiamine transporter